MTQKKLPPQPHSSFADLVAAAEEKQRAREMQRAGPIVVPTEPIVPNEPRRSTPSLSTQLGADAVPINSTEPRRESKDLRSMRSRERRSLGQFNCSLPLELIEELRSYTFASRRALSDIAEQALYEFLERNWGESPSAPNVPRRYQMMIDDKDSGEALNIINHQYQSITQKTFTEADKIAARTALFPHVAPATITPDLIRAGIFATLLRTREPRIHSFRYFIPEIIKCASGQLSGESLAGYARHVENRCRRAGKYP